MQELTYPAPCVQSFSEGVKYTTPETAAITKLKMDHERWRHEHLLSKLESRSKIAEEACSRNVQQARDQHLKTIAYLKVCQIHSFEKYDPFKDEPLDGKTKRRKRKRHQKRRENTFLTLANLENEDDPETLVSSADNTKQRSNLTYTALNASFPQIATLESKNIETDNKSISTSNFNALVLWKNASKKLFEKSPKEKDLSKEPLLTKRQIAKLQRPQRKTFLPGECKTQAELRRFMEQEVLHVMHEMTAPRHKKDDSIRKMVEKAQLPDLIRRDKTFSAIVRDFKTYKEEKEERKHRKMLEYINRHYHCAN